MAEEVSPGQVQRWLGVVTTVIAPATLLSALLFYFGYVSSREQYAYFGIDVDTIGLGTRDYVMRSPQPLLVPLLALALLGAAAVLIHVRVRRRIAAGARPDGRHRLDRYRSVNRAATVVGGALLAVGIGLLLGYSLLQDWAPYSLVTPLLLAAGAVGLVYTARLRRLLAEAEPAVPAVATVAPADPAAPAVGAADPAAPAVGAADPEVAVDPATAADPAVTVDPAGPAAASGPAGDDRLPADLRRGALALAVVLIIASLFWATATVAQWSGRGLARHYAARLDDFPSVILDTQERLYLRDPGVQETALPAETGQRFRYRYRHLRLLIEGHDRMFLVPDVWSVSDSTLLVPLDSSVRVQFQFRNESP